MLTITHVATPGDLDGSFGTNGKVILLPGPPNENVCATPGPPVLIASDGSSYGVSVFDRQPLTLKLISSCRTERQTLRTAPMALRRSLPPATP